MSEPTRPGPRARLRPGPALADHVTDAAAALLLLTSLALPWDLGHQGSERVDVVLVTLLSVASLALPHLARAGVLPAGWTVLATRRARLLANVPYVVLVMVHLLLDAVSGLGGVAGLGVGARGVGYAVAVGLAGAVLAAQPRRGELGPLDQDRGVGTLWSALTVVLVGACALLLVVGTVAGLVVDVRSPAPGLVATSVALLLVEALQTAVLALPLATLLRRGAVWHPVVLAIGAAVALGFVCAGVVTGFGLTTVTAPGVALFLVPAAAAAGTGPAALRVVRPRPAGAPAPGSATGDPAQGLADDPARWFRVASRLWLVLVGAAALQVLTLVLQMVVYQPVRGVAAVLVLVLLLSTVVTSLVGRACLVGGGAAGASTALLLAGAGAVIGVLVLAVVGTTVELGASGTLVTVALWLPVAVVVVLTVPPSARAVTFDRSQRPAAARAAYEWYEPQAGLAPEPARHLFTPAQAGDPATDPALLATICAQAPELRPHVAANPAAYPALLQWLSALGDDRVDHALRTRSTR